MVLCLYLSLGEQTIPDGKIDSWGGSSSKICIGSIGSQSLRVFPISVEEFL